MHEGPNTHHYYPHIPASAARLRVSALLPFAPFSVARSRCLSRRGPDATRPATRPLWGASTPSSRSPLRVPCPRAPPVTGPPRTPSPPSGYVQRRPAYSLLPAPLYRDLSSCCTIAGEIGSCSMRSLRLRRTSLKAWEGWNNTRISPTLIPYTLRLHTPTAPQPATSLSPMLRSFSCNFARAAQLTRLSR